MYDRRRGVVGCRTELMKNVPREVIAATGVPNFVSISASLSCSTCLSDLSISEFVNVSTKIV